MEQLKNQDGFQDIERDTRTLVQVRYVLSIGKK